MIFITPSIVSQRAFYNTLAWPVFLWNNLVTMQSIFTSSEDVSENDYPVTNLWNTQTSSLWKAESDEPLVIEFDITPDEEVDSLGIARHNWGTCAAAVQLFGVNPDDEMVLLAEFNPSDDTPILSIFEPDFYTRMIIFVEPAEGTIPQAAHVATGSLLKMSTGIPVGHVPIKDALDVDMLIGEAENGDFLGDIVRSQRLTTTVNFRLLDETWYRENMRPFVQARIPFFFGWAPTKWPDEVTFAKFQGSPKPIINQSSGELDIALPIIGLGL